MSDYQKVERLQRSQRQISTDHAEAARFVLASLADIEKALGSKRVVEISIRPVLNSEEAKHKKFDDDFDEDYS